MRAEIFVSGIVQGVGFRPFIYRTAVRNGLVGYVRNRGDAIVEIVIQGKKAKIKIFLDDLKSQKPPLAQIHKITTRYKMDKNEFNEFKIIKSSCETQHTGSVIPPDVSICEKCLQELRNPENRRFEYFFITCTNCGPRYTIINKLPYDRPNTKMKDFKMCSDCANEFTDPENRRFHAQTIACSKCGPKIFLASNKGILIESEDPIRQTGRLLEEGYIVAIKGNGGFHIATATTIEEPIARLRSDKHRNQKPFAIMSPKIETVRSFAEVNRFEEELLSSYRKPIILLNKKDNYYLSNLISPELHTIGVMLPYTGLHVMLFDLVNEPAFVMTSANPPNEPIVTENDQAIAKLGSKVDYFLFHNRPIAQRCDDSVVRFNGNNLSLIRRSRGYAPEPIDVEFTANRCVLAVGGELNVTSCILIKNNAFISQHIGDVENLENLSFLKDSIKHLTKLINCEVDIVACDLHPKFTTTRLAQNIGKKMEVPVVMVQHHHAHAAALMAEWNLPEIVAITCDGFGYGSDGLAWGGEILHTYMEGYKRVAHLEKQPMVGGDLATYNPLRMVAGILHKKTDISEWLLSKSHHFHYGRKEVNLIMKQLERGGIQKTTSCGRVLDSISAMLGICYNRTYEGEPAMKLESKALEGRDRMKLYPKIERNVLDTTFLVQEIFANRNKFSVADLAYSAQSYLAKGLSQLAVEQANQLKVKNVGFTGGVAYNSYITNSIKKNIKKEGLRFFVHKKIPTGDGGTSFGQAIVANHQE